MQNDVDRPVDNDVVRDVVVKKEKVLVHEMRDVVGASREEVVDSRGGGRGHRQGPCRRDELRNNSSWLYLGDNLGHAAADELVTQLFKTQKAESNLDIRLINTDTAEIMFADEGEGKVRLGGVRVKGINYRQEFDTGLAQEALRPAVEDVVRKIADRAGAFTSIQPPAAPTEIVGGNGASFYIDKGENYGIVAGHRYAVHRVVDEIRDADGNLLDTITNTVDTLEVTRVLGQSAICRVIEGDAAEGDSLRPTS